MREALWFSRAIRLFGVKELFDAVIYIVNWLLQYRSSVVLDVQRTSIPHRELFWASLSVVIGIVLLRYASEISLAFVGRRGPRRMSNTLSKGGNSWLFLCVRCMAFYALLHSMLYLVNGFFASIGESRIAGEILSRNSFHYFIWGIAYATTGAAFSLRPDIICVFLPFEHAAGKRNIKDANKAAEPTRTAVTPPAGAGDRASGARGSP